MALQHLRALQWRGEDLGFGGGNTRELSITTQVAAGARPNFTTQAFAGTYNVNVLGTSVTLAVAGKNRLIVNRNARYWLTVTAVAATANGSTGNTVSFPIAPLQMFFVPQNLIGPLTIAMNSAWPIPQPVSGSPGSTIPLAAVTNALSFDWVVEP